MVKEVECVRHYDTSEVVESERRRAKDKYLNDELTEEEYVSRMSQLGAANELAGEIETMKAEKYEELEEQYQNDEISEDELEAEMDRLFESGDEFLDVGEDQEQQSFSPFGLLTDTMEGMADWIAQKLNYYALPILVMVPIIAVIVIPGINPMLALLTAPALLTLGLLLYLAHIVRNYS
jgi:hypothetical protein